MRLFPSPSLHPLPPLPPPYHKDARQLVQGRHVEALVKLAHVARAVAEKVDRHRVGGLVAQDFAPVLDRKRGAEADGDALANERETAEQAVLFGEHVHRPALPAADARLLAEELRHDLARGHVLGQGVHVVAVGGADEVVLAQEARGG